MLGASAPLVEPLGDPQRRRLLAVRVRVGPLASVFDADSPELDLIDAHGADEGARFGVLDGGCALGSQ